MTVISFRDATLADVDGISAVATHTYADAFGADMEPEDLADVLETTRSPHAFRSALQDGHSIVLACQGNRIVGYVMVCDNILPADCARAGDQCIKSVFVHPDAQGAGAGRKLMQVALALPRCLAAHAVYLDVWEENARALGLYLSLGFSRVGVVPVMARGKQIGEDLVLRKVMEDNP